MPETQQLETKQGYKKTKLGWIPKDWEVKQLKNLLEKIVGGGTPSKGQAAYWNGDIPWATVKDFTNFNSKETRDKITRIGLENSSSKLIEAGTVIIPTRMALGKAVCFEIDVAINQDLKALYTKPNFNRNFLLHWFYFKSEFIESLGNGSTVKGISLTDLGLIKVKLPPLPEQKAIANCLSTWDDALVKLDQLITAKQRLKKALMQQLLSGKKRLPGFTGEWEEKRIEDLAKEYTQKNDNNEDIEVLSCTKYDGLVPSLEYFGRQVFGDDLSKYKIVPKGYFAYATNHIEEGSIGYQDFNKLGLVSPMYTVFKTDDTINDNYFFKLLKSHRLIHEYNRRMEGSIDRRGGLRWKNFKRIKLTLPSYKEQTAIAEVLNTADREIQMLKSQREQLQAQKKGLMQQLLTGKKRLKC